VRKGGKKERGGKVGWGGREKECKKREGKEDLWGETLCQLWLLSLVGLKKDQDLHLTLECPGSCVAFLSLSFPSQRDHVYLHWWLRPCLLV